MFKNTSAREPYSSTWNYEVAVYKGDELVHTGTLKETAEYLGVKKRTVLYHLCPAAGRRADRAKKQDKVLRIVRIDK